MNKAVSPPLLFEMIWKNVELLLIYDNSSTQALNITRRARVRDAKGERKVCTRKKKSHLNQPCTDFIDCVVVKTSEKKLYTICCSYLSGHCFIRQNEMCSDVGHLHLIANSHYKSIQSSHPKYIVECPISLLIKSFYKVSLGIF